MRGQDHGTGEMRKTGTGGTGRFPRTVIHPYREPEKTMIPSIHIIYILFDLYVKSLYRRRRKRQYTMI